MNMLDIASNRDVDNTCQAKSPDIVIYGPAWVLSHPWSGQLLRDLIEQSWSVTTDSSGRYHAIMPLSMTEGQA